MARVPGREAIYDAAQMWKERCLIDDGSVFGAGSLSTLGHLDELDEHFVRNADDSDASFLDKMERQLAPASPGARQLAAELLWAMMLFSKNVGRAAKARVVTTVWAWSGTTLPEDTALLVAPYEIGIGNTGTGFNTHRWRELAFLIGLVRALKRLDPVDRRAVLGNSWRASEWISSAPDAQQRQLRHILLHLLFPDTFEPTASAGQRRQFLSAFRDELARSGAVTDLSSDPLTAADQELFAIRRVIEADHPGEFVNYYVSPWRDRWDVAPAHDPDTPPSAPSRPDERPTVVPPRVVREGPPGPRVWVIGAGEGATRWAAFRDGGYVAIGWDELGDLNSYPDVVALQRAIKTTYQRDREPSNDAFACFQFCREMAVGDEVFVKQGRDRVLAYGVVRGGYAHDATRPDYRNVRAVRWEREGDWTVPEEARFPTKTLTEVTSYQRLLDHLRPLVRSGRAPEPSDEPYTAQDALVDGVFLDRAEFERILAALRRRKNVILQGAPGVGKSFVARRLAYALIGAKRKDAVQTVQFHQSYAYEDFVQGWRPSDKGGFTLRNGVFYEFCRRAQARPTDEPHVFVIDEINRGNLSKILGELMLLIEADKRGPEFAIPLTYATFGDDTFHVPENLFIIGLMNTADRSLAMVDYALRRRFAFVTLEPQFASHAFADVLRRRGVDDATVDAIRDRVARVNAEIVGDAKHLGRGFEIGHSYFVPAERVDAPAAWYRRVVDEEVRPLLEEYWFDDAARVRRCVDILLG